MNNLIPINKDDEFNAVIHKHITTVSKKNKVSPFYYRCTYSCYGAIVHIPQSYQCGIEMKNSTSFLPCCFNSPKETANCREAV